MKPLPPVTRAVLVRVRPPPPARTSPRAPCVHRHFGRTFARCARRVLGLLDEATAATTGHLNAERGRVRLAAVTTAGEHVAPRYLASFRARYPEAEVVLEVGDRTRVCDLLDKPEVDLSIGGRPRADGRFVTPPAPTSWSSCRRRRAPNGSPSDPPGTPRWPSRESVQVGLGITLISEDAVARELEQGMLGVALRRPRS